MGQEQRIYRGAYDAWLGTGYFNVVAPTATLSALRSDVAFPAPFNVPITFTATATANAGAVEYKFVRYSDSTGWVLGRDYSANNVYSWYPPLGTNVVQVWVRAVGSTAAYQDYLSTGLFNVVAPAPRIGAVQANVAFPAAPTSTITWTALASGGAGPSSKVPSVRSSHRRLDRVAGLEPEQSGELDPWPSGGGRALAAGVGPDRRVQRDLR